MVFKLTFEIARKSFFKQNQYFINYLYIMFKYTRHTLKKIESLFESSAYQIRYERGSFQSGYCLVEDRKIIVINRFFEVEGRINTLIEILNNVALDEAEFDEKQLDFYQQILSMDELANTESH